MHELVRVRVHLRVRVRARARVRSYFGSRPSLLLWVPCGLQPRPRSHGLAPRTARPRGHSGHARTP
eukprot:373825-Lingulodinium_polyedra.AAC.1